VNWSDALAQDVP